MSITKEKTAGISKKVEAPEVPVTMNSIVIAAPGEVEIKSITVPEPAEDEVLIRMEGSGICASNIPVWEGREWFDYPQEAGNPGHEGYGIIVKKGDNVKNVAIGDRVAALSFKAYAEYDIAKGNQVVKLPEELKDMPFPGEPLGCAMNIFKRADIKKGQTVAIIGIGFLGALLVQLAKDKGARVIALSKRPFSLEIADKAGADVLIPLDDHWKIIEQIKNITNENFCDRVIECTGKQWPLDLAGELTAVRGKLVVAGFHQDGPRQVNMQLWNWRGIDVINAHERDPEEYIKGIKRAVKAVKKGKLQPASLFTHKFKMEDAQKAFEMLKNRPEGFVKGVLMFKND